MRAVNFLSDCCVHFPGAISRNTSLLRDVHINYERTPSIKFGCLGERTWDMLLWLKWFPSFRAKNEVNSPRLSLPAPLSLWLFRVDTQSRSALQHRITAVEGKLDFTAQEK